MRTIAAGTPASSRIVSHCAADRDRSSRTSMRNGRMRRSNSKRCAPYKLPADKYETWADVTVNFSLADML